MTQETWLITGASSGLGAAFATYALSQGHNLIVTARRLAPLKGIEEQAPDRVLAATMDVTQPDQIKTVIDTAVARFGRIDVLINNAGYGIVGAVEETPEAELRAQMETNFFGAVAVTQAVLPQMRAQGSGAIAMISSLGGQLSFAGFGPYSASKFALEGLSEALAQEVAPFGIKVMIVEPGEMRTDFAGTALKHMPRLPAYDEVVGGTRDFARGMNGTQSGDPARAAMILDAALKDPNTPLRLQLGADAVDSVRAHSETLLAELAAWADKARSVAFDETAAA